MVFIDGHLRGTAAVLVGRGGVVGSEVKCEEAEHIGTWVLEGVYSRQVGEGWEAGGDRSQFGVEDGPWRIHRGKAKQEQGHEDEKLILLGLSSEVNVPVTAAARLV